MSKHLDADQMAEWMAGERLPEMERHLRECAGCRLALEEMQTALGGWREAVRGWSDREYQAAQHVAQDRAQHLAQRGMGEGRQRASRVGTVPPWVPVRWYWAGGATAACALAAALAWHNGATPALHRSATPSELVNTLSSNATLSSATVSRNAGHGTNPDAAFMRQVDREVSQTVPDALEPLMGLVSWDADEGTGNRTADGKENSKRVE